MAPELFRNGGGRNMHRVIQVVIAVTLLLVAAASRAADPWQRLEVDGFTFSGDVGDKRLRDIAGELRLFRYAIATFITTSPSGEALPVRVLAVRRATWEQYLRPREGIEGIFVPGPFGGDIIVNAESGWEQARMVVFHEFTHYYVHNLDKFPYPPWFSEGVAQFFEPTIREGRELILGRMPYGNWLDVNDGKWIPTARLVQVDHQSPEYVRHDSMSQFYGQSRLFVHYLLVGNRAMQDGLGVFMSGMVNGQDPAALAQSAFGQSFEAIDAALKAYYQKQRFQVIPLPAPRDLAKVKERAAAIPGGEALREAALAGLRARPEDPARLGALFEGALGVDPADARAMAGFAIVLRATGDRARADGLMSAAIGGPRADSAVLTLCGDYHASAVGDDAGDLEGALACYRRAVAADPANYAALVALAMLVEDPSPEDNRAMIAALQAGITRYPQSEFLGLALAKSYFNAGEFARSRDTLRRAANLTRDPGMRRRVAALLRTLPAGP